jgi:hypothetical protein
VTLAVKSRLGPNRDARNTIEARQRAESVDNNRDNCSRHYDDRECSWSPNQRGLWAFGRSIRDAKFPSRFQAPTNVPRYDGDTNPSVWLEGYRLACHAGGATHDLFVIKNLLLYLGDYARTWPEHLPRDKNNDWTNLRRVFVGNFQGTYMRPAKQWELRNCKQQSGRVFASTYDTSPSPAPSSLAQPTTTPSQHSRTARHAPPLSTDSGVARLA